MQLLVCMIVFAKLNFDRVFLVLFCRGLGPVSARSQPSARFLQIAKADQTNRAGMLLFGCAIISSCCFAFVFSFIVLGAVSQVDACFVLP